jgi:MFS family permease
VVVPILPFVALEFGAGGLELGALLTAYSAAQFACAPAWGRLSDRFGRRPVLLATIAGTAVSLAALGLAPSLAWMFVARLAGGAFAANLSVASAYITDVTDEEERTRWMGLLGASFGIGFTLGPAIGGALAPFGLAVPLLFAAGLAAANGLYAVFVLHEPPERVAPEPSARRVRRGDLLRIPALRRLCALYFVFSVAVTQLETIFPFFMHARFDYGASQVAVILVAMAVLMGGIQGGGMRALSQRYRESMLVGVGSLALGAAFLASLAAPTVAWLLLPLAVAACGRAVAQPSLMSLASFVAPPEHRGLAMGTFQSSASLARVVGPLLAGALYDLWLGWPFAFAGALALAVGALALGAPLRGAESDDPASR